MERIIKEYIIDGIPDVWRPIFKKELFVNNSLDKIAVQNPLTIKSLDGSFEDILLTKSMNYFIEIKKGEGWRICVYDKKLNLLGCTEEYGLIYEYDFIENYLLITYDKVDKSDLVTAKLYEDGKFEIVDFLKSKCFTPHLDFSELEEI